MRATAAVINKLRYSGRITKADMRRCQNGSTKEKGIEAEKR